MASASFAQRFVAIGRAWSFRDVTARKRILRELRELDRIRSDCVSTVSHELPTPLTSSTGYVELLRDGDAGTLSAAQDRMLEVVDFNTQRLLAQIEDLLTLSQIESGTFEIAHIPIAVETVIRAVAEVAMPQAAARSQELVLDAPDDLPVIVKSIIDHHGGKIDIESSPGVGTTVVVTLPTVAARDRTTA
jgi:signal transduction histidine kinase